MLPTCHAVFESEQIRDEVGSLSCGDDTLCPPYELFPLCPNCGNAEWYPLRKIVYGTCEAGPLEKPNGGSVLDCSDAERRGFIWYEERSLHHLLQDHPLKRLLDEGERVGNRQEGWERERQIFGRMGLRS